MLVERTAYCGETAGASRSRATSSAATGRGSSGSPRSDDDRRSSSTSTARSRTTSRSSAQIFVELFAEHGRPLSAQEYFDGSPACSDPEIVRTWLGHDHPDVDAVIAERVDRYRAAVADGSSVPRARARGRPLCRRARAGRNLLRRGPGRDRAGRRGRRARRRSCAAIVSADDVVHGKPHPEGYLHALELPRRRRGRRCSSFEDTEAGIASAKRRRPARDREDGHARPAAARRGRGGRRPDRRRADAPGAPMLVIAHRGASWELPENTLAGLRARDRARGGHDRARRPARRAAARSSSRTASPVHGALVSDARGGARAMPRTDRRDRRAEDAAAVRTLGRRLADGPAARPGRRARLLPAAAARGGARAAARPADGAARRPRRVGARRARRVGRGLFERARDGARHPRRPRARARPARLHGQRAEADARARRLGAAGLFTDRPDLALPLFRAAARP